MSHVDHCQGRGLSGRSILPGPIYTPECWALVGHSILALGHKGFEGRSTDEVPVDVGLGQVREQPSSSCQVVPIHMCRVVGTTWLV